MFTITLRLCSKASEAAFPLFPSSPTFIYFTQGESAKIMFENKVLLTYKI